MRWKQCYDIDKYYDESADDNSSTIYQIIYEEDDPY